MAWFEDVVFFSVAVGYTMPWAALSSELGYFKMLHGPNFLLFLNLAYFLPSVPILLLQLALDQHYNWLFGTAVSTLARQGLAQIICAICCLALPFLPWTNFTVILTLAAVIGTVGSAAFGSSNQLVGRFPAECGQALALGVVAAGALVLIPQAVLRLGAHPTSSQQIIFFFIAALYSLVAVAAIIALVRRHWHELQSGSLCDCGHGSNSAEAAHDSSAVDAGLLETGSMHGQASRGDGGDAPSQEATPDPDESERRPLLDHGSRPGATGGDPSSPRSTQKHSPPREDARPAHEGPASSGSPWAVARAVAPLAASLGSSVGTSVLLFPLFTVVRSSGRLGCMLPQALFAARMLADILSRIAARAYVPPVSVVQALAAVKVASLAVAVAYMWAPQELLSDVAAIAFVAGHWASSGLVGAWSYMLLPQALPKPEAASHAGNVMSASFQISRILGLVGAAVLEYTVHVSGIDGGTQ